MHELQTTAGLILFLIFTVSVFVLGCIYERKKSNLVEPNKPITSPQTTYINELPSDADIGSIAVHPIMSQVLLKSPTGWTELAIGSNHQYSSYPLLGELMEFEHKGIVYTYDGMQWSHKKKGDNNESLEQTRST